MKPGKGRKDRPKGVKSFNRSSDKKIESSGLTRPDRRDNRREDRDLDRKSTCKKLNNHRSDRRDGKSGFKKQNQDFRKVDYGHRRHEKRGAAQDAVAGKKPIVEALRAKIPAKELVVALKTELDEKISEAIRLAKNLDLPIKELPRRALDDLTGSANHQGIALVIKPFNYSEFSTILRRAKKPMMLIGVDGITDPHNLGAIVRSAAAFGADGVVIPERRNAAMTGSAWKASAGAAARMPISQVTNLVRSIDEAKKAGCFVIGLDADGDQVVSKMNLASESIFIIVGSEGKGLSRLVRENCDLVVSIPMQSDIESLNASVATAIVMHWVATERSK
jgi:23S rRNA (guanosine2251-2'-O)-methyltransferase